MQKKIEMALKRQATKKGLTGEKKDRYVYGTLNKIKKKKQTMIDKKALSADYQRTFSSEFGKNVLDNLSKYCMEHRQTFDPNSTKMCDYNAGARSVILHIRELLEYEEKDLPQTTTGEYDE